MEIKPINKKRVLKWALLIKLPLTIYLVISLVIFVPAVDQINAEVIKGAHRGASIDYEENTLESFEKALSDPDFKFIEFDITYSKDKEIIVIHQNNMWRIPKKGIIVSETNYSDIQEAFEFYIPKYQETMDLLSGEKPLNIEIKSTGDFEKDKELAEYVINDCKKRGILDEVMISSISDKIVEYIESNHPKVKSGKIYWVTSYSIFPVDSFCSYVYETPADYVLLHGYNIHNYNTLVECKPEDKKLMFWYFTDEVYILEENNYFWQ